MRESTRTLPSRRIGSRNKKEKDSGSMITKQEKLTSMLNKPITWPEWEECLRTRWPWRSSNNWKICNNFNYNKLRIKKIEKESGEKIKKTKISMKLPELIWVISWLKTMLQPLLSLLHIGMSHIISRVSTLIKLKTSKPKELIKWLKTRLIERTWIPRIMLGQFKTWLTTSISLTTSWI